MLPVLPRLVSSQGDAVARVGRVSGRASSATTTCGLLQDSVFIPVVMEICHRARRPLTHLYRWLLQPPTERIIDGDARTPGKVADLVWGKAEEILSELDALTESHQWALYFTRVPPELRSALAECIQTLTLGHHADFHRRIVHCIVDAHPARLLLIAKRGRKAECPERLRVAQELWETDGWLLDTSAKKLMHMFAHELTCVVDSGGQCPGLLWLQVAMWCKAIPSDTGYIEGVNNMIISAAVVAPAIKLPLLSSRIVGRCALLPAGVNTAKTSEMKGPMAEAVQHACNAFVRGQDIAGCQTRWRTPPPLESSLVPARQPCPFSPTAMTCWRHYNAKWIAYVRSAGGFPLRCLLSLPDPDAEGQYIGYITPHIHGWSGHLLECEASWGTA